MSEHASISPRQKVDVDKSLALPQIPLPSHTRRITREDVARPDDKRAICNAERDFMIATADDGRLEDADGFKKRADRHLGAQRSALASGFYRAVSATATGGGERDCRPYRVISRPGT